MEAENAEIVENSRDDHIQTFLCLAQKLDTYGVLVVPGV